jgi:saccharopine dehydrogenase (NADP+, L-glutamate forming)
MAHVLVDQYKNSSAYSADNSISFRSYCGGFPKIPNDFKYKFSWSPLGVLGALRSPAKWIEGGKTQTTDKPWKSLKDYRARLPDGEETFQSYPNRNSVPFIDQYEFDKSWNVQEFVRGTLRLNGWAEAWSEIFELVDSSEGDPQALAVKSDELWQAYQYDTDEPDRVVLSVELQAQSRDKTTWHQTYCLDAYGNENGSAMARLVSLPVSVAVDSVIGGRGCAGVSAATTKVDSINLWFAELKKLGEKFELIKIV